MFNYRYDAASDKKQAKIIFLFPSVVAIAIGKIPSNAAECTRFMKRNSFSLFTDRPLISWIMKESLANFDRVAEKTAYATIINT